MRFRGDDDSGIARTNGRANKTTYFGDHEVIALVKLNDVSVLIALAPSRERIGHVRHLRRAGFQRLKLAHKLFPSPSFRIEQQSRGQRNSLTGIHKKPYREYLKIGRSLRAVFGAPPSVSHQIATSQWLNVKLNPVEKMKSLLTVKGMGSLMYRSLTVLCHPSHVLIFVARLISSATR